MQGIRRLFSRTWKGVSLFYHLPSTEPLKSYFQIALEDDEQTRREKVAGKVVLLDRSLEDTLPYIFFLLGIPHPDSSLEHMDAAIRRQRTFDAIKRLLLRESLNQPVIAVFEDLHWIDGETQAFLDVLSESVASARILLLVNYRPEYRHSWAVRHTILRFGLIRWQSEMLKNCSQLFCGAAIG